MHPRRWAPLCAAVITYMILSADSALAWGPAAHVQLAGDVLSRVALLPASLAALLTRCAVDFLYGNVAADVVFAKRASRVKGFCHHWETGFGLLSDADNDRRRAFALGYLSHLAADTVAHNKFVPHQLMTTRTTLSLGHPYWELRADQFAGEAAWVELRKLIRGRYSEHESLMAARLDHALLPFRVNRRLFYSMNRLFSHDAWRRGAGVWHQWSRWELSEQLVSAYWCESVERAISVIRDGKASPVLREDPNGTSALSRIRVSRRHLRCMARAGVLTVPALSEAVSPHRPAPAAIASEGQSAVA